MLFRFQEVLEIAENIDEYAPLIAHCIWNNDYVEGMNNQIQNSGVITLIK